MGLDLGDVCTCLCVYDINFRTILLANPTHTVKRNQLYLQNIIMIFYIAYNDVKT